MSWPSIIRGESDDPIRHRNSVHSQDPCAYWAIDNRNGLRYDSYMTTYLSQTDAAGFLGMTRQRVSALIKAGRIKAVEIGGRPLISQKELDRFKTIPRKGGRPPSKA